MYALCATIYPGNSLLILKITGVGSPHYLGSCLSEDRVPLNPLVHHHWTCSFLAIRGYHYGKSQFLIGKPSINGPFSMAMLNNQRVYSISRHTQFVEFCVNGRPNFPATHVSATPQNNLYTPNFHNIQFLFPGSRPAAGRHRPAPAGTGTADRPAPAPPTGRHRPATRTGRPATSRQPAGNRPATARPATGRHSFGMQRGPPAMETSYTIYYT